MAKKKVVITGIGVLSPIGASVDEVSTSLFNLKSGIVRRESALLKSAYPVGVVPNDFSNQFTKLELPYLDRCQQMAIIAARDAIKNAGFESFSEYGQRAGVFYGNVRGGSQTELDMYGQLLLEHKEAARPFTAMAMMQNAGAAQISIRNKILGPVMTHSSACTSSATAIGEALRAIQNGYLDVAVAGGAEAPLNASMFHVFNGTRALASCNENDVSTSCRPFSKDRTGLVLGEGAAFVILESFESAMDRNVSIYATVSGYGIASDGHHIGQPKMEGQVSAIHAALADSELAPTDIQYFNAHATATRGGDEVEAKAIKAAFGSAWETLPVSSTKSVHGHLLGAASALELVITTLAMKGSFVPATANLDEVDQDCSLNHVRGRALLDRRIEHAMSFSCGFGGTNVALILSR